MSDLISREAVRMGRIPYDEDLTEYQRGWNDACDAIADNAPEAQREQRYTEEELRVFQHGISLSLLSKRSSQHWQYDDDTATEIKFLERLYEKVAADMRGEQDDESGSD